MATENENNIREIRSMFHETEIKTMNFINKTLEIEETKSNPEMVSALAGLLSALKKGHY